MHTPDVDEINKSLAQIHLDQMDGKVGGVVDVDPRSWLPRIAATKPQKKMPGSREEGSFYPSMIGSSVFWRDQVDETYTEGK
ncbi:MAG: hypothetical protein M1484_02980 [Patescibacteria group bacterium]|nr:hypothetical protein [Patescibacteria group bacterium]